MKAKINSLRESGWISYHTTSQGLETISTAVIIIISHIKDRRGDRTLESLDPDGKQTYSRFQP